MRLEPFGSPQITKQSAPLYLLSPFIGSKFLKIRTRLGPILFPSTLRIDRPIRRQKRAIEPLVS